jgi:hypothetical protein
MESSPRGTRIPEAEYEVNWYNLLREEVKMNFDLDVIGAPFFTVVAGALIPLVVGLLTKASWSSKAKAWILAVLSALAGFFNELAVAGGLDDDYRFWTAVANAIVTFVVGVAVHYGFWKPVGTTAVVQSVLVKD